MGIEGPCAPVVGDGYSGVFRDNRRARTRYRVLVPRSGARRLQERPDRPRDLGRDASVFLIAPGTTGRYDYRWIVAGRAVAPGRSPSGSATDPAVAARKLRQEEARAFPGPQAAATG